MGSTDEHIPLHRVVDKDNGAVEVQTMDALRDDPSNENDGVEADKGTCQDNDAAVEDHDQLLLRFLETWDSTEALNDGGEGGGILQKDKTLPETAEVFGPLLLDAAWREKLFEGVAVVESTRQRIRQVHSS